MRRVFKYFVNLVEWLKDLNQVKTQYKCCIMNIEQNTDEDYFLSVQIRGQRPLVKMKPEDILVDDELTNCFSPCDVRTMTYLGYLGINNPKYKILAKRLSKKDNRLWFALKEKGSNKPIIKTAEQIRHSPEILASMAQEDAHMVGYTDASEEFIRERDDLKRLIEKIED
jgi:hypothetical protein